MKKLLLVLFTLIFYISTYSQTYSNPYPNNTVKVEVSKTKSFAEIQQDMQNSIVQGVRQNAALSATMEANRSAALANNSTTINTDFLINNDGTYRGIVLNNISGWKSSANKSSIQDILGAANKYFFYKSIKDIPAALKNSDKLLFLDWIREAPTDYDRITTMILKNISRETVFEGIYKNKSHSEILAPLTTGYSMSDDEVEAQVKILRSDAIKRIKDLKELLDMGIITQDEFDSEAVELKKIILSK
tara:strand:+ start:83 stop:820 length:738 start_codon:yes stop_codon:yes gene_type:complete